MPRRNPSAPAVRARTVTLIAVTAVTAGLLAAFTGADLALVQFVNDHAFAGATSAMLAISDLAATDALVSLTTAGAVALVLTRHWHGALALCLSVVATQAFVALVKGIVERDRPPGDDALVQAAGHSFPSAHSASSVALYGVLALIAVHELRGRSRRASVLAAAVVVCAAVGGSRVYLGAHYPSDVLAGWVVGALVAFASWRAALALFRFPAPRAA